MWGEYFARVASWLTLRRIRAHAVILAVILWGLYAADLSTPGLRDRVNQIKGTDFVHFYTLGSLALQARGNALYRTIEQAALAENLVPGTGRLYYVALYGPQVSLFFAPFARLPYGQALLCWWLFSALLYAVCCYGIWKVCPRLRSYESTVLILAVAYPAFFHLIAWGQTSAPALICFTIGFLALRAGFPLLAGLAIGFLAFKPPLGVAAAFVFVFAARWRVVIGALISGAAQMAIAWLYWGSAVMQEYANALRQLRAIFPYLEPRLYEMHSLRSFWAMFVPWPRIVFPLYVATSALVLVLTISLWRGDTDLRLRYSALLIATVLVAPHLTVYDLVILSPAFLLMADWVLQHPDHRLAPTLRVLLYLAYGLPLLGPLTRWTHFQLSVLAFAGLLVCIGRLTAAQQVKPASSAQIV